MSRVRYWLGALLAFALISFAQYQDELDLQQQVEAAQ